MEAGIRRTLVLSTEHLPPEIIGNLTEYPLIAEFDYGIYVLVPVGILDGGEDDVEYPLELRTVLEYAHKLNCQEVKFDSDGLVYEDLPVYPW